MVKLSLLTAVLASVSVVLASFDEVLPEVFSFEEPELIQTTVKTTIAAQSRKDVKLNAWESAKTTVAELLQSGETNTSCRELANATVRDIAASVDSDQQMLDNLNNGTSCKELGVSLVANASRRHDEYWAECDAAAAAVEAADDTDVYLDDVEYAAVVEDEEAGNCNWLEADAAYRAAEKAYNKAVDYNATVCQEAVYSEFTLDESMDYSDSQKHDCSCEALSELAVGWKEANQNNDDNQISWTESWTMLCYLDGISEEDCDVPPCPTVHKPYIDPVTKHTDCKLHNIANTTEAFR